MPIKSFEVLGLKTHKSARITHTFPNNLTTVYTSIIKVTSLTELKVGTPLECPLELSKFEVQLVVSLLLNKAITVGDQIDNSRDMFPTVDDESGSRNYRTWKTYGFLRVEDHA
jgi:hypothetical protein